MYGVRHVQYWYVVVTTAFGVALASNVVAIAPKPEEKRNSSIGLCRLGAADLHDGLVL